MLQSLLYEEKNNMHKSVVPTYRGIALEIRTFFVYHDKMPSKSERLAPAGVNLLLLYTLNDYCFRCFSATTKSSNPRNVYTYIIYSVIN